MSAQHCSILFFCVLYSLYLCCCSASVKQTRIHNGSLDGTPAFLGYFRGVFLTFSIITSALPISDPGSTNLSTFSIFPPNISSAFSDCCISSSESALLYDTKHPPFLINGRQYSLSVDKFATCSGCTQIKLLSVFFLFSVVLCSTVQCNYVFQIKLLHYLI